MIQLDTYHPYPPMTVVVKPSRVGLSPRRKAYTVVVKWAPPGGVDHKLLVTYGISEDWIIREAFCAGFRSDSQNCALANDACILLSRLLQYGETIDQIAPKLGEDRAEGASAGPPSSIVGAIAREGSALQNELYEIRRQEAVPGEPASA